MTDFNSQYLVVSICEELERALRRMYQNYPEKLLKVLSALEADPLSELIDDPLAPVVSLFSLAYRIAAEESQNEVKRLVLQSEILLTAWKAKIEEIRNLLPEWSRRILKVTNLLDECVEITFAESDTGQPTVSPKNSPYGLRLFIDGDEDHSEKVGTSWFVKLVRLNSRETVGFVNLVEEVLPEFLFDGKNRIITVLQGTLEERNFFRGTSTFLVTNLNVEEIREYGCPEQILALALKRLELESQHYAEKAQRKEVNQNGNEAPDPHTGGRYGSVGRNPNDPEIRNRD